VSLVLDEHRAYLADTPRLEAFDAALRALVRPGDVVLDLASGTGILGLLACRAGARRVYAIEMGSIAELARDIARANGFGDRVVVIQDVSTRVTLPEAVDLIVMDAAGRFGFDGGSVETLSDARRRFLKTDGRIIPSAVTLSIAPCDAAEPMDHIAFWSRPVHGLSFGRLRRPTASNRLCASVPQWLRTFFVTSGKRPTQMLPVTVPSSYAIRTPRGDHAG